VAVAARAAATASAAAVVADLAAAAVSVVNIAVSFVFPKRGPPLKGRPRFGIFGTRDIVERSPHCLVEQPGSRSAAAELRLTESR
jgi:hypothetical protein